MQAFNFQEAFVRHSFAVFGSGWASVQAATLSVNCGGQYGLTSINAALKRVS